MRYCGEDVTEIEVKPDGSWRVKTKTESERRDVGDLAQWHFPDGTLCVPDTDVKPKVEVLKEIKQEGFSGHTGLKLGIRKNRNGIWEFSKPEDMNTSDDNRLQENFANGDQKVMPMTSSATGSGRDGEDQSVNQDGGGHFDFSTNNGIEMDSMSLNVDSAYVFPGRNSSAPTGNAEVIVLSDSEGEDDLLISSGTVYKNNPTDAGGINFSVPPPGIADTYPEDPALGPGGNSCLGLFNDNDFGMPLWPPPPGTQAGPGFQFFGSDADVPDSLVGLQHESLNCSTSMNGYRLAPETALGSTNLVPDPSVGRSDADLIDGLVDNPLAFAGEDPSLQIFLPTGPSDASVQTDMRDRADVSNGVRTEDWISLRLGGGTSGGNGESAAPNGSSSRQQIPSREGGLDSLADTGMFPFDVELLELWS